MESKTQLSNATIKNVQDLVEINIDSAQGFEKASELVEGPFSPLLKQFANQRRGFAGELASLLEKNGLSARTDGSWEGRIHRWWLDLRNRVASNHLHAVLAEAKRGEDTVRSAYEDTLRDQPASAVSDVLHHQLAEIKAAQDRIRDLRDASK